MKLLYKSVSFCNKEIVFMHQKMLYQLVGFKTLIEEESLQKSQAGESRPLNVKMSKSRQISLNHMSKQTNQRKIDIL